ncbi:hypothetical protein KM043_017379 [Ampulex compressa]|nr:hypothetical protein KM043_017379 [Ampulex compressa]
MEKKIQEIEERKYKDHQGREGCSTNMEIQRATAKPRGQGNGNENAAKEKSSARAKVKWSGEDSSKVTEIRDERRANVRIKRDRNSI